MQHIILKDRQVKKPQVYPDLQKSISDILEKYGVTQREKGCIGYSPKNKLWYGWSHRAINGFKSRKEALEFAERVS